MKINFLFLTLIFALFGTLTMAQPKPVTALPPLTKSSKSLFLIKKAKIDNDVGEPVLYPSQKQSKSLADEKIFNKYRLQILDTKNR